MSVDSGYCVERRCLGTWWAPPPSKRPRRETPVWRVRFPSTSATRPGVVALAADLIVRLVNPCREDRGPAVGTLAQLLRVVRRADRFRSLIASRGWSCLALLREGAKHTTSSMAAVHPLAVSVAQLVAQGAVGPPLRHRRVAVPSVVALAVAVVLFVVHAAVGEVSTNGGVSVRRVLELTALVEHLVFDLAVAAEPAVGRVVAIRVVEQAVGEPGHVRPGGVEGAAHTSGEVRRNFALVEHVQRRDDAERHRIGQQFHIDISNRSGSNLNYSRAAYWLTTRLTSGRDEPGGLAGANVDSSPVACQPAFS